MKQLSPYDPKLVEFHATHMNFKAQWLSPGDPEPWQSPAWSISVDAKQVNPKDQCNLPFPDYSGTALRDCSRAATLHGTAALYSTCSTSPEGVTAGR